MLDDTVESTVQRAVGAARAWFQAAALVGVLAGAVLVLRFVVHGASNPQSVLLFTSPVTYLVLAMDSRALQGRTFHVFSRFALVHSALNLAAVAYLLGRG